MRKIKTFKTNAVRTKVVGGIGNQVFCYFAGYHLSQKLKASFEIDTSDIRTSQGLHKGSIEELKIQGKFVFYNKSNFRKFILRLFRKAHLIFPGLHRITNYYASAEIGFDPYLETLKTPIRIDGYFQSYKYVYPYLDQLTPLELNQRSEWFNSMKFELQGSDFLSIHIRRGDYVNLSSSFGILGLNYYLNSIKLARQLGCTGKFVIFSDSMSAAKKMLASSIDGDVIWIEPPQIATPFESLSLMSLAGANIIANSTFSWWGAALNKNQSVVIAPSKWFRNKIDPSHLYPSHWHTVESTWAT